MAAQQLRSPVPNASHTPLQFPPPSGSAWLPQPRDTATAARAAAAPGEPPGRDRPVSRLPAEHRGPPALCDGSIPRSPLTARSSPRPPLASARPHRPGPQSRAPERPRAERPPPHPRALPRRRGGGQPGATSSRPSPPRAAQRQHPPRARASGGAAQAPPRPAGPGRGRGLGGGAESWCRCREELRDGENTGSLGLEKPR